MNVVVTGGSKGIGLSLCNLLSSNFFGYHVFTCGRSGRPPELSQNVSYTIVDIENYRSVEEWIHSVPEVVDVLVNNAAVLGERATIQETSVDSWVRTMRINVDGAFFVTKAVLQKFNPEGVICNVSSSVGRKGRAQWGAYSVSKCALEGLTDILVGELPNATVFSANPGGTATEMRAGAFPSEDPGTLPTADDIARIIAAWIYEPAGLSGEKLNCRDALGL